jgi:UDP-glucose 4-epimerase
MQTERHFVTGAAGFIGSHLLERLLGQEQEVIAYDNFVTGTRGNLEQLLQHPNLQLVEGDILDLPRLTAAMESSEVVWHLAANTDIPRGTVSTALDLENCTVGTQRTLEAMRLTGVRKMIFASSATVYGDIETLPTPETAGPLRPISLYGAAKLACEALISAYAHLFGIQGWIYRFGNIVGGRMGHGVIYDLIQKLRRNPEELEILGDGEQEKPYLLIEDCLAGMELGFRRHDAWCDIFNLGVNEGTRVKRIAWIVIEEMGLTGVRFRYTGGRRGWPGDAPKVSFDISKISNLGWKPSHTSEEAVRIAARRLLGKA